MNEAIPLSQARRLHLPMGVCFGLTDTGLVRSQNEDNFLVEAADGLAMVADGMGGHQAGALASAAALVAMRDAIRHAAQLRAGADADATVPAGRSAVEETPPAMPDPLALVRQAMLTVNQRLYRHNTAQRRADGRGMGTTLTGLWQPAHEARFIAFHIGDSRLYRLRDGHLQSLTRDQTLYQRALDAGQTVNLPARNLLWQAVGPYDQVEPEVRMHDWLPGDAYLLCSDGLHGMLSHAAMEALLAGLRREGVESACRSLVAQAKAAGGRDNITAVLLACAP